MLEVVLELRLWEYLTRSLLLLRSTGATKHMRSRRLQQQLEPQSTWAPVYFAQPEPQNTCAPGDCSSNWLPELLVSVRACVCCVCVRINVKATENTR